MLTVPEGDLLHAEGVIVDACGGESDSQHVLGCWDVVWGRDTVQICHIAKKKNATYLSVTFQNCASVIKCHDVCLLLYWCLCFKRQFN